MKNIGWSQFARDRHKPDNGFSYFQGDDATLFNRIRDNWDLRKLGAGTADLTAVCLVPVFPKGFVSATVLVENAQNIETVKYRRREGEEYHLKTVCDGPTVPANYVDIVLYSRDELKKDTLDGKQYESPYDWEIVSINVSDVEDEPMHPLAMARNQLAEAGGNPRVYSTDEWARAVWFWSKRLSLRPKVV